MNDQPIYTDQHGVRRFKANAIVEYLLNNGPFDMNHLARLDFPDADRVQFAQLIGYSVSGWGDLPYVSDEDWDRVNAPAPARPAVGRAIRGARR